jgi:hypothetical protein
MSVKFSVYQYNRQTRTVHLEAVHHESLAEKEVPVHYLLWENSHYDATYPLPPSTVSIRIKSRLCIQSIILNTILCIKLFN